ncbi:hypothetical protein F53441_10747 [Fusarium austroafricanum]|uniref:Uncharacterized protein n=1 Tax=Fusarium austroafricanum TaxID=2364996 RepID=A0A8H4K862_9HYPO|nr:hypothetical protein F53441_10747 [Fusarium austroafricanum]
MSYYSVYLVESMGMPRNHHAIFVKTGAKEEGTIFNVTGNAMNGFDLEIRETYQSPRLEATFQSWAEIGVIAVNNLPRVQAICEANPPPGKQYHGLKKIDPAKPLRRCQEWTSETIGHLREQGVLLNPN